MQLSQRLARIQPLLSNRPQPKKMIALGEFLPDLPDFQNPGCTEVRNAIPHAQGYKSFPSEAAFSGTLTARCQGAFSAIDRDGNVRNYASDVSRLYRLVNVTWTDASKSGGYTVGTDERWEFARWKNIMVATHIGDPVQSVNLGSNTFADMITSTLKPQARHIAISGKGPFVVLGNMSEDGTNFPNRVRWSGIDDNLDFDQNANTQSDFQDLESSEGGGGWLQRLFGDNTGWIAMMERSIFRAFYTGGAVIFDIHEIEKNRGLFTPGAAARYGRYVFYLAEDGFYVFDGTQSVPIGKNKIDLTFQAELDTQYLHRITTLVSPLDSVVMWSYTTSGSAGGGDPDKILAYNWSTQKWARIEIDTELIYASLTAGETLDTLDNITTDLDALAFSLDSRVWTGGIAQLSTFNRSHVLTHLTGTALAARFETAEMQLSPGQLSTPTSVRSLVEGTNATTTITVGRRTRNQDAVTFGTAISQNANGEHPCRDQNLEDRYHRIRLDITGGFDDAQAVEVEYHESGWQ